MKFSSLFAYCPLGLLFLLPYSSTLFTLCKREPTEYSLLLEASIDTENNLILKNQLFMNIFLIKFCPLIAFGTVIECCTVRRRSSATIFPIGENYDAKGIRRCSCRNVPHVC